MLLILSTYCIVFKYTILIIYYFSDMSANWSMSKIKFPSVAPQFKCKKVMCTKNTLSETKL